MAHYMAINKSGKNLPIFSGWPSVDKGNQIGTIYNREVFIYGDTEDGVEVYFRNSSGRIVQGFYYATDANGNDLFSSNAEAMKALSSCIDYPFSTVTIGGTEYYWLNEIATITNKMGNPGSIYVRVVAYDKNKTAHTIVSKSPEIGVGASYETPVIDKDYAKYTVSIMAASEDGTYSIRYHD